MLYLVLSTLYSIAFSQFNVPCVNPCDLNAADSCDTGSECVEIASCAVCVPTGFLPESTFPMDTGCGECSMAIDCYSFTSFGQNRMTCIIDDATGCGECAELCTEVGQCSYIGSDFGCEAGEYCSPSATSDSCGVCMDSPIATACGECSSYMDCNDLSGGITDVTAICTYDDMGCGVCEDISDIFGTTEVDDCQPDGDFCSTQYEPVCCSDGMTYSNDCYAKLAGQCDCDDGECSDETSTTQETTEMTETTEDCEPDASLVCITLYEPVCCDEMTYSNECYARAAGKCDCDDGMCMTEEPDMMSTDSMEETGTTGEPGSKPGDDANRYGLIVVVSFVMAMFSWM